VAIAITNAPSVADIGLSGTPVIHSTSDDHPVANTIGIKGTNARLADRYTASRTRATARIPTTVTR
jgi:hypothetical protein